MVLRKEQAEQLENFDGTVEVVEYIRTGYKDSDGNVLPDEEQKNQYHLVIKPTDEKGIDYIKDSKTKRFHAFITMSETSTESSVASGSIMDNYLSEVEACLPETKKMVGVTDVMYYLRGKTFAWILKKVGRAFQGKDAKQLYVPRTLLKDVEPIKEKSEQKRIK